MNQNRQIAEDSFLQARVADRRPTYCWLGCGTRLQGIIVSFDEEAIFMRPTGGEDDADLMMIYKVQIASMMPVSAMNAGRARSQYLRAPAARAVED